MARRTNYFEDIDQHERLVNLNARVPKDLWRRVRVQCLKEERLLRHFIPEALRQRLRVVGRSGTGST